MKLICIITLIAVLLWYRDIKENLTQVMRDLRWLALWPLWKISSTIAGRARSRARNARRTKVSAPSI